MTRAAGGPIFVGEWLVGERGPELVRLAGGIGQPARTVESIHAAIMSMNASEWRRFAWFVSKGNRQAVKRETRRRAAQRWNRKRRRS